MGGPYVRNLAILLSDIVQGEQLIREQPDDDSIGELAESLAHNGQFQAIGVRKLEGGRYQLLWGDRRCRAARRLGWEKIDASIYDRSNDPIAAIALVENMQRRQLSLSEEIAGVRHLAVDKDYSVEKIASALSKSRSWVLTRLMADNLPEHIRAPLLEGSIPLYAAEMIAVFPDTSMQKYFVGQVIQQRWTKSQLKQVLEANSVDGVAAAGSLNSVPGIAPSSPNGPLMYPMECCGITATLANSTLVRCCADGHGCRSTNDRSDHESDKIDGLERPIDGDNGLGTSGDDHPETK
jgi:ParB/RepB/Spo0J family partition protein